MTSQDDSSQPNFPQCWNITHPKNLFFTGQKETLENMKTALGNASQPLAICGLGGIGKTQIALEYAYRWFSLYDVVLWAQADSRSEIISSYTAIAVLLRLSHQNEKDETIAVSAVKDWLQTHRKWLLILDNCDNPSFIEEFIPPIFGGHVLLTTRSVVLGTHIQCIELKTMTPEVGALFLLRRGRYISSDAPLSDASFKDREQARKIVQALGGLPLALNHAGAYLEKTGCSLFDYLSLYREMGLRLLQEYEYSTNFPHHPTSVATTWSLSFKKVEQQNLAAAELLRFYAFLHPDAIPKMIVIQGGLHLGAELQALSNNLYLFNKAVGTLRSYSLININHDAHNDTLNIHRLVQAVLKDSMNQESYQLWATRAVDAVNDVFPSYIDFSTWHRCELLVSHAQTCILLIEQIRMKTRAATQLLNKVGRYLYDRGRYAEAESYLQHALATQEGLSAPDWREIILSKVNLADLYDEVGRYSESRSLLLQALAIQEEILETNHPDLAMTKTQLAWAYLIPGEYKEAEALYAQALEIRQQSLGPEHIDTAISKMNLAWIYYVQGKYGEAEPLCVEALAVHQQKAGIEHPFTARDQNTLALLYTVQGKYAEAEKLLLQAIDTRKRWMGPEYIGLATSINNLAQIYHLQKKYAEAESLYNQALEIQKQRLGSQHPDTASTMSKLGSLYCSQGNLDAAEPLLLQSLRIQKQQLGMKNLRTAKNIANLANLYVMRQRHEEAKKLFQQALDIYEQQVTITHADRVTTLRDYTKLLEIVDRKE
jgi:tetratricopeptide (TPR) repeat protein